MDASPAPPPRSIRREVLPNGLVLLLDESHLAAVAEVQIWARVGSADESPGEAGLAHFHEHMLFKGTEGRGVAEVAGAIEGAGGRVNAYTSYDTTVYHATVPSAGLGLALDVLADMVRGSVFDAEELQREIAVVLEEIQRSDDSPAHVCAEALFAAAYRRHPYRRPILGSRESVASFDRERVTAFYRRWYAPDNLLVVASGDFDADAFTASVRSLFGDAVPAVARRTRAAEPGQQTPRAALLRRPFERACFEIAWPAVPLAHPDTPHLDLLAFVLGEGDSSRLVRRVKEAAGVVDRIDASCYTPVDRGLFEISADLDGEQVPDAIAAIAREVEMIRHAPVSDEEIEKARANFLASEHFERESVSGRTRKLGTFEAIAGDWRGDEAYLDAVRRATPQDLLRVARAHLDARRVTVAAVLPEDAPSALDEKSLLAAAGRGAERIATVAVPDHLERADPPAATVPLVQVKAPPKQTRARLPAIESYQLGSGAVLHVEPRHDVPVLALRGAFHGGLLGEDADRVGLTPMLTSMWLRGTRRRGAAELAHAIESIACDIDGFAGRSGFGLSMEATSDRFGAALDLFAEVLLEPAFREDELERERRDTLAALARREDRLGARAFDLFTATLWQTHPYRWPVLGTPATVASFARRDLLTQQARWVRGPNLVLALSGDVDPDTAAEHLSIRLAGLDATPCPRPNPPAEPAPAAPRFAELRKDRAQAHLVLGFRGLTVNDPDRFGLDVITQLLAGQGGRLFLELRDRRGLAYSVSAVNVEGAAPGFFAVTIGTSPEKLDDARRGILDEFETLVAAPPRADELERARRYLIGNFEIDRQHGAVRAAHMAIDALHGLGADAQRHYADHIAAVSADDVVRVARRVIDLSAPVEALIRP
ncbi:insulinase family protein [Myxococcota bacterium]|nr:insulinase family protein [Myxococcota bacterium]MCZ7620138.1 insulinase family protein [Myxococcota bacterium]